MSTPRLILASASPARLATLRSAGLAPEVEVSGVDEDLIRADPGRRLLERLTQFPRDVVVLG